MAKITPFVAKNGKYRFKVSFVKNGTSRKVIKKSYEEACEVFYEAEEDHFAGLSQLSIDKRKIFTLIKLMQYFIGYQVHRYRNGRIKATTYKKVKDEFNRVSPEILSVPINRLSKRDVEKGVPDATRVWLRAAFTLINERDGNSYNPVPSCMPKKSKSMILPIKNQINRLFELAKTPREKMFFYLAAVCGLRVSEIMALRMDCVTQDKILIIQHVSGGRIIDGHKSGEHREIKVSKEFILLLKEINQESVYVIENTRNKAQFLSYDSFRVNFIDPIYREAGVSFTTHDLRHYAVSRWIAEGRDILQVQKLAGHKDIMTTIKIYGHLLKEPEPVACEFDLMLDR